MSLGAGAVDGFLDSDGAFLGGFHGIEDVTLAIVETDDEVGFDLAAAAETPGGAMNFFDEDVFEETARGKLVDKAGVKGFVAFFFTGPDEVSREEAEGYGVFCGFGFSGVSDRTGGVFCVSCVGCDLSCCRHFGGCSRFQHRDGDKGFLGVISASG